jgi:hypothetical protein
MHSPHRAAWLAWALLLAAPMAAAQSPQCGLFKADEGSSTLRISSPNRGEQKHFGSAPSPVAFQQIDGKLQLVNLEYGLPSALQVRDRGRTVEVDGTTYILQAPHSAPQPPRRLKAAAWPMRRPAWTTVTKPPRPRWKQGAGKACPACACNWLIVGMRRPNLRSKPILPAEGGLDAALSGIKLPAACDNGGFEQETRHVPPRSRPTPQCRRSWSRPR